MENPMQCPNCGAYVSEKDAFCGECGEPLAKVASPAEPISPPPRPAQPQRGPILVPRSPAAAQQAPRRKQNSRFILVVGLLAAGLAVLGCLLVVGTLVWRALPGQETPVPTVSVLLYEESFDDPASGWDVYDDGDSSASYVEGEYELAVTLDNYMAWGNPQLQDVPANLEVDVDSRQVEGPLDNNFGLLVRYQPEGDSFYWFEISSDGYYSVDLMDHDEWTTLVDWAESDAIYQGLDATNHLQVVCDGDHYNFYVNDIYLTSVIDGTLSGGTIGLAVGAFDEPGVRMRFDNVRVYPLQE
jgi:hypothetical protein